MPSAEFNPVIAQEGLTLRSVDHVRRRFGTSFEATLYRMATSSREPVAAGRFCFRNPKTIDHRSHHPNLFGSPQKSDESLLRYRRQSFHHSASYPQRLILPWNKSLRVGSVTYRAAQSAAVMIETEDVEVKRGVAGRFLVEAVPAPYQPADANGGAPDMLVLLQLIQ